MKLLVCILVLAAYAVAGPVTPTRRLALSEKSTADHRFLYFEKNGEINVEDLKASSIELKATVDDVTYYLYTQANPANPVIFKNAQVDLLKSSNFDSKKTSVFITHGWNNDHSSLVNQLITPAFLENYDVNVFVVDWGGPANKNYLTASYAVEDVAVYLGDFINSLLKTYQMTPSQLILIGHSLGAHVSGGAAAAVEGLVDHVVGLDPALPLFTLDNTDVRLDTTDAKFVEVIHTCGGYLGFLSPIGHSDYFPNGGSSQPGCGLDLIGTCAHGRAYHYFAESVRNNQFISRECKDFDDYSEGLCSLKTKSLMGGFEIKNKPYGDYFLATNPEEPYGRGE